MSRTTSGLKAWLIQRISAIYLMLFSLWFVFSCASNDFSTYHGWYEWFANPLHNIAFALFFCALLIHAWIGFRDIIMDYVPALAIRLSLFSLLAIGLLACGLWALKIILRVN